MDKQYDMSFVLPVYNVEAYIKECLESIVAAIPKNMRCQFIIVDDGTPDGSMAAVEDIQSKLPNLVIIEQKNQGLSAARNAGLTRATGRFVWFIDTDDTITPVSLLKIQPYIADERYDIVATQPTRTELRVCQQYPAEMTPSDFFLKFRKSSQVQFFIFKRSFLNCNDLRFAPGILHEDILFTAQSLSKANTIKLIDETIYNYREGRPGSIMSSSGQKLQRHVSDMLFVASEIAKAANSAPIGSAIREALSREVGNALSAVRRYARNRSAQAIVNGYNPGLSRIAASHWRYFTPRQKLSYMILRAKQIITK